MKTLITALLLEIVSLNVISQSTITFNKTYHVGVDVLFNVLETPTGYLTVSAGLDYSNGSSSNVITQTDFNGDTLWRKMYGDTTEFHVNYGLVKTYDGNFLTGSYCYNRVTKKGYVELLKFNNAGSIIWKKNTFPANGFDYTGEYLIETSDRGFLITGQYTDSLVLIGDGFILKTDSLGNEQWHAVYGGNNFENLFSSVQLIDNSYLSLGWTRSYGFGNINNRDVFLVKTDSAGNFLWRKTFGSNQEEIGIGIDRTTDGNFLIATGKYYPLPDYTEAIIYKIDTGGNIIWSKQYVAPKYNEIWWSRECSDKSIISVGSKTNSLYQQDDGWLLKTDSLGNQVWERQFRLGTTHCYFRDVQQASDGGYIAAGFTFQGASGGQDAWLVKLDSLGCDSVGCATYVTGIEDVSLIKQKGLNIFPNPAKDFITLSFSQPMFTACRIRVIDILGKEIFNQTTFIQKQFSIPVYSLHNGVYVVEVLYEGKKEYAKFIRE